MTQADILCIYSGHRTSSRSQTGSGEVGTAAFARSAALTTGRAGSRSGAPRQRASTIREPLGQGLSGRRAAGVEAGTSGGPAPEAIDCRSPAHCAGFKARTRGPRIPHRSLDSLAGGGSDPTRVWRKVLHRPCLACAAGLRLDAATACGTCLGTERSSHPEVETPALAGAKKNAQRRGQTIIFVDESGLSERPHRYRTWAPRGQTPVLQYHFRWKTLSLMAGITWWNFY